MTAAIFALIGALLGISGTLLVEIHRQRTEDSRSRREALRVCCADFTDAIIRVREFAIRWQKTPSDQSLRESTWKVHDETWVNYERLRLLSTSMDLQEAGRHLIRYTWGLMRQAEGKAGREDEQASGPLALTFEWLQKFYVAARRELGVPQAEEVYMEPAEWRSGPLNPTTPSQHW